MYNLNMCCKFLSVEEDLNMGKELLEMTLVHDQNRKRLREKLYHAAFEYSLKHLSGGAFFEISA